MAIRAVGPNRAVSQLRNYQGDLPVKPIGRLLFGYEMPQFTKDTLVSLAPKPKAVQEKDTEKNSTGFVGLWDEFVAFVDSLWSEEPGQQDYVEPWVTNQPGDGRTGFGLRPNIAQPSPAARRDVHRLMARLMHQNEHRKDCTEDEVSANRAMDEALKELRSQEKLSLDEMIEANDVVERSSNQRLQQLDQLIAHLGNDLPPQGSAEELEALKAEMNAILETVALVREQTLDITNFDRIMAYAYLSQKDINERGAQNEIELLKEANKRRSELFKERLKQLDEIAQRKQESWIARGLDCCLGLLGASIGAAGAIMGAIAGGAIAPAVLAGAALVVTVGLTLDQFFEDPMKKKLAEWFGDGTKASEETWLGRIQAASGAVMVMSALASGSFEGGASTFQGLVEASRSLSTAAVGVTDQRERNSKAYFTELNNEVDKNREEWDKVSRGLKQMYMNELQDAKLARETETNRHEAMTGWLK